jgi:hypothetical protein
MAGLAGLIASQVQGAFKILGQGDGGLAPPISYVSDSSGAGSYDPATGTVTESSVTYAGIPAMLVRFTIDEMDNNVVPITDRRALIPALDLPVAPKVQDYIILSTGERYMVERVLTAPGDSLHTLHVRKTA